jgi:hypothetical protein
MESRILVIIPAYNEEKSVGRVIRKVQESIPDADVVVIDDGSSDNTAKIVQDKGIRMLSHSINLGPGAATQTGYKYALEYPYDFVVQLDADGQHDPQHINDFLRSLESDTADMVIGSRFLRAKGYRPSWIRRMGMVIFAGLTSLIIGQRITDSTSGFRALKREVVDFFAHTDYPSDYQDADIIFLAHSAGFRIREIPVIMHKDLTGKSFLGGGKLIYYGFKVLLSVIVTLLREKPLR